MSIQTHGLSCSGRAPFSCRSWRAGGGENAQRGQHIRRGQAAELQEILDLADALIEESAFGYARRILARACKDPTVYQRPALRLRLAQKRALAAAVGLGWLAGFLWSGPALQIPGTILSLVAGVVAYLFFKPTLLRACRFHKSLTQVGIDLGMCSLGWIIARLELHLLDRFYLRWGRIDRLVRRSSLPAEHPPISRHGEPSGRRSRSTSQG